MHERRGRIPSLTWIPAVGRWIDDHILRMYLVVAAECWALMFAVYLVGHDAADAARIVYAYMEGLLTQARIQNNVELLKEMSRGVFTILGVKEKFLAAA